MNRTIKHIKRDKEMHWVGNGFPVRSLFSYGCDPHISPFLLLDYAGPADFEPSDEPRGVERHPHRGFETVTIVYEGEVEHRDTAGNAGKVGPGDVQWMTAAKGVLHEEMHSHAFTRRGGRMEMVQLWVNLPARYKMADPRYQEILSSDIPVVKTEKGSVRIIAGEFNGQKGAANTFTPVHLLDIYLHEGESLSFPVEAGFNASFLVREGTVEVDGKQVSHGELALLANEGDTITLTAMQGEAKLLFMAGEPIDEPIVGAGPFVMNTEEEIRQAYQDYRSGKFHNNQL